MDEEDHQKITMIKDLLDLAKQIFNLRHKDLSVENRDRLWKLSTISVLNLCICWMKVYPNITLDRHCSSVSVVITTKSLWEFVLSIEALFYRGKRTPRRRLDGERIKVKGKTCHRKKQEKEDIEKLFTPIILKEWDRWNNFRKQDPENWDIMF